MLLTVGYERRDPGDLVALLVAHGVEVLVDVRATPRSRRPGLSKRALAASLQHAGIAYRHEPALGVPREEREAFRAGDEEVIARFERRLEGEARPRVAAVVALAHEHTVALLCYERAEADCHRRLVAAAVTRLAPAIEHAAIE